MAHCPICSSDADVSDTRCAYCGVTFSFISGVYPTASPPVPPEFVDLSLPEPPTFSFEEAAQALDRATQRLSEERAQALYVAAREMDTAIHELHENIKVPPRYLISFRPNSRNVGFAVSRFETLANSAEIWKENLTAALSPKANEPPSGQYVPNEVPLVGRIVLIISAALIVVYAGISLIWGYSLMPIGGKRSGGLFLVQGLTCIPYSAGLLLAAYALLLQVLDHYDKRDNEHRYATHSKRVWKGALACALLSIFMLPLFQAEEFVGAAPDHPFPVTIDRAYLRAIEQVQGWGFRLLLLTLAVAILLIWPNRKFLSRFTKRLASALLATMFVAFGLIFVTESLSELINGTAHISRYYPSIARATNPRLFHAVTVSRLLLGVMAAWAGVAMLLHGMLGKFDRFGNLQSPFSSRPSRHQ